MANHQSLPQHGKPSPTLSLMLKEFTEKNLRRPRPQLPPVPPLVLTLAQRLFQRLQVTVQAGIPGLEFGFSRLTQISPRPSPIIARRQGNHPKICPVGTPAANVATSEARLDKCAALLVLGD